MVVDTLEKHLSRFTLLDILTWPSFLPSAFGFWQNKGHDEYSIESLVHKVDIE